MREELSSLNKKSSKGRRGRLLVSDSLREVEHIVTLIHPSISPHDARGWNTFYITPQISTALFKTWEFLSISWSLWNFHSPEYLKNCLQFLWVVFQAFSRQSANGWHHFRFQINLCSCTDQMTAQLHGEKWSWIWSLQSLRVPEHAELLSDLFNSSLIMLIVCTNSNKQFQQNKPFYWPACGWGDHSYFVAESPTHDDPSLLIAEVMNCSYSEKGSSELGLKRGAGRIKQMEEKWGCNWLHQNKLGILQSKDCLFTENWTGSQMLSQTANLLRKDVLSWWIYRNASIDYLHRSRMIKDRWAISGRGSRGGWPSLHAHAQTDESCIPGRRNLLWANIWEGVKASNTKAWGLTNMSKWRPEVKKFLFSLLVCSRVRFFESILPLSHLEIFWHIIPPEIGLKRSESSKRNSWNLVSAPLRTRSIAWQSISCNLTPTLSLTLAPPYHTDHDNSLEHHTPLDAAHGARRSFLYFSKVGNVHIRSWESWEFLEEAMIMTSCTLGSLFSDNICIYIGMLLIKKIIILCVCLCVFFA